MQKVRHNKYSICVTILGFSCENGRMIHNIVTKMDEVKKVKWLLLFITKIFRYQRAQVIFTQNVYFLCFMHLMLSLENLSCFHANISVNFIKMTWPCV